MDLLSLIAEIEQIVRSGTRINLDYHLNEILDEDQIEEIFDYFMEADSEDLQEAHKEFDGEYDEEELRLVFIKFLSEVAN
jgi:ATP-dependent DNA helicase RecQ